MGGAVVFAIYSATASQETHLDTILDEAFEASIHHEDADFQ